jgi:murein DD-endopeptidase MepM/ murein hydrolase activator NlpD
VVRKARPRLARKIFVIAVATAMGLLGSAGTASALTGGAPTAAGGPPPPPSPAGQPASGAPSAGTVTLVAASATPRKTFYYGVRYPSLQFTIESTQPANDLRIDVLDAAGTVIKSFFRNDVAPNTATKIRWDGSTSEGRPARNGRYRFQVTPQSIAVPAPPAVPLRRTKSRGSASVQEDSLGFDFYAFAFPVLGAHDYGEGAARFGAGRSGHTHQGQDVMADCGLPLVAARGGTVQYEDSHSAAGNYLVIDGKGTSLDFLYAHLAEPSSLNVGDRVRTGQPLGLVGDTGNAQGCHLHFEMWAAPGWYQGGTPLDPYFFLQRWDRYS